MVSTDAAQIPGFGNDPGSLEVRTNLADPAGELPLDE